MSAARKRTPRVRAVFSLGAAASVAARLVTLSLASCATLWGFDDLHGDAAPVSDDGGAGDVVTNEAAGNVDASGGGPVFHGLDDESRWTHFDVAAVNPRAVGFHGLVRDERYVYFVPYRAPSGAHGVVARYDTTADFAAPAAWSTFDVSTLNAGARGFVGGAFDGRYIYLAPYSNGAVHGNVVRFDTLGSFTAPSAWTTFDVASVSAGAKGFFGAVFDGRYVYLVPQRNGAAFDGVVARYDTRGDFTAANAWSTYDIAALDGSAVGFFSGTFDGRYVYLCPSKDGVSSVSGRAARYDTQGGFDAPTSWAFFDVSKLTTTADKPLVGATYSGGAAYFGGAWTARFDPELRFDDRGSWDIVNTTAVALGSPSGRFVGTSFDTKYLYLAPFAAVPSEKPIVVRHRVGADNLSKAEDWSSFDISRVAPVGENAFWGSAFDGRHLYFAPVSDGVVTRFEAVSEHIELPIPPSFL